LTLCGSALEASNPVLTAVSPQGNIIQTFSVGKPHLTKDANNKDEIYNSANMVSNIKQSDDDRVIPFNPSMFSPREDQVTGRGALTTAPIVSLDQGNQ